MTPEQIYFLGILASALTFLLNLLLTLGGVRIGRGVLSIFLFLISLVLAVTWGGPISLPPFPPFTDVISFVAAVLTFFANLVALAGPLVAFATLIYNVLYSKVIQPFTAKIVSNFPTRH